MQACSEEQSICRHAVENKAYAGICMPLSSIVHAAKSGGVQLRAKHIKVCSYEQSILRYAVRSKSYAGMQLRAKHMLAFACL